jgi:hypothetical protein
MKTNEKVEMKNMSVLQALVLINVFANSLKKNIRSQIAADTLIGWRRIKIDYLVKKLFSRDCSGLSYKPALPIASSDYFNLSENIPENAVMTVEQALEIIKVFSVALQSNFCLRTRVEEMLISGLEVIDENVNDLFNFSPGLNLFEYQMHIQKLLSSSFIEVQTFDGKILSVCTDDAVCEPYGVKTGDRLGGQYTVVGVVPKDSKSLVLCLSNDVIQYRSSLRPVVEYWSKEYLFEKFWIKLANKHLEKSNN